MIEHKQGLDPVCAICLSYLIGDGIAAVTNTWWLSIVGSVGSRLISERGNRKFKVYENLKSVEKENQAIIERLKPEIKPA